MLSKTKIVALLGLAIGTLLGFVGLTASLVFLPSFTAIEAKAASVHVERVLSLVAEAVGRLNTTAGDYAGWDDAYRFVQDRNPEFVRDNLTVEIYPKLGLNLLAYADAGGRIVHARAFDLEAGTEVPLPRSLEAALSPGSRLLRHRTPESEVKGILSLPEGLLLVASRPVLTSEYEGPIQGALVLGRFLDASEVARLAATSHLSIRVVRERDASLPPGLFADSPAANGAPETAVRPLSAAALGGYGLLRDLEGRAAGVVALSLPREIRSRGIQTILYFLAWFTVLGLTFFLVSRRLIDRLLSARRRHEETLERYRTVVASASEGIALLEPATLRIVEANRAFLDLVGYGPEELARLTLDALVEGECRSLGTHIQQFVQDNQPKQVEQRLRRKDGSVVEAELSASRLSEEAGDALCVVVHDVTDRKRYEEELLHQATHDALTGLPNRSTLQDRLAQAVGFSARTGQLVAVMLLDLDRFKIVNDTLGHAAGDRLLKLVSERLKGVMRRYNTVARLGGDEFVLILANVADARQVVTIAQKVQAEFREPFELEGRELFVSASIGISLHPLDGEDVDTLLKHADTAMYQAKEEGRDGFRFYSADMNRRVHERLDLETQLRRAVQREEFVLHYQPRVDVASGRVAGVEALLRWQPPGAPLMGPDRFIPVLEETGLIIPVGEWVLRTACRQGRQWLDRGMSDLQVGVNLSARQFRQNDLPAQVRRALDEAGFPPALLVLEITETIMMDDVQESARKLQTLKEMGVRIAMDDFGTGYSSLSYLRRFPIDDLKIDKSFVRGVALEEDDAVLVRTILDLAKNLRMEVVAEGVETLEQLRCLEAQGCKEVQGYYFGRPAPAEELEGLLAGLVPATGG